MAAANSKPLVMLLIKILDIFGKKLNHRASERPRICCLGSKMQYFGYSRKNTFSWETNIFEAIFPLFFQGENLKTCFAFHFQAQEKIFLEQSKSVKMTRKSQIQSLQNHGFLENQVFLPTEQAETYLKIYILIYHSTYICPNLFGCKENLISRSF